MIVRRSLLALALGGGVALSGAAAGCDSVSARWSDPEPAGPAVGQVDPATAQDPPPTRRNSLEMTDRTVYFLEGVLPMKASDGTTSALAGALVLRGECHDGSLRVVVNGPDGTKKTSVECDGQPHERGHGTVKAGDALTVTVSGKSGTDFAIELAVK